MIAGMTPFMFIPGFMLDRDLWAESEPLLADLGPAIHPDLREAMSIADMARRTLVSAPERFTLVGFSMGGYVAREVARLAPDRVNGLILIATSMRADSEDQRKAKAAAAIGPDRFRGLSRGAIHRSLGPDFQEDAALVDRIRQMSLRLGGDVHQRQVGFRRDGDGARLTEITCPTLIVAGRFDRLRLRAEAEELRDGIAGARLVTVPAGHMVPLETPRTLARIIRAFISVSTHVRQDLQVPDPRDSTPGRPERT
jgi:pimeloyl-ACP methyl ester carboxylesterase